MKTTRSRLGRPAWLIAAALGLLAAVPFLLPRHAPMAPGDEHSTESSNNNHGPQAATTSTVHSHQPAPDTSGDVAAPASKPTKTRDRGPQAAPSSTAPSALAASSNNSPAAASAARPGAVNRLQSHTRDDGPLVQALDSEATPSPAAVAASQGSPLTSGIARATTTATATTADPAAATKPAAAAAEPAIVRTPAIPLSHMIDDDVEAVVAAELAPDVPLGTMEAIRQTFEQEAGVHELAQDDPAYAERWAQAEPAAAERIRALYGWGAFQAFQRKLVFEQLEARKAAGQK